MKLPRELWPIVYRQATAKEWPPRTDSDIRSFFNFANRENLLPLLMDDSHLPEAIAEAKTRYWVLDALNRKRHALLQLGAVEVQRVLGVDSYVFHKGFDYSYRLYRRPDLRPMADIDIFVPVSGFSCALSRLAAAGYPRIRDGKAACFAPNYHEREVVINGVYIDMHRSFVQPIRARIDYDAMWHRREWFQYEGIGGYRFSPQDALLAHAYNGLAVDEFCPSLIRYVDFYLMLQKYKDLICECVGMAKEWGIERALFGALHVTSSLFPSTLSLPVRQAMGELLNSSTRQFLVSRVLPNRVTEPGWHVTGRYLQLRRKFFLMDQRWRRFGFIAYHAYEMLAGMVLRLCERKKVFFHS